MDVGVRMVLSLIIGLVLLILLVTKTKIHVFPAMVLCAILIGIGGGMDVDAVISSVTTGFGNSLSSIGIIIGFGVMLGKILEISDATSVMANTFLHLFGKKRELAAVCVSGYVTSLSIFCTSGFVLLFPLIKALSLKSKKSIVAYAVAMAGGLAAAHSLVPPAAGPIGVAGILGVNVGLFMAYGTVLCIPLMVVSLIYARYIGKKIYQIPEENGGWTREEPAISEDAQKEDGSEGLPAWKSMLCFAPILCAVLLILLKTILGFFGIDHPVIRLLGQPVFALALGLLIGIYGLTRKFSRKDTLNAMEEGLKSSGKLMLLVGGGGALGRIIQDSGLGDFIANGIVKTSIPALLLPFLIAVLLRVAQGSSSVAMMTAASVVAPMVSTLGLNPLFAALAACVGSIPFSHFNDSFFWVINDTIGIRESKEQMRIWSINSTVGGFASLALLFLLNAVAG